MKKYARNISLFFLIISIVFTFGGFQANAASETKVRMLVQFNEFPGKADKDLIESHKGNVLRSYKIVNAVSAEIPEQEIEALRNNPNIRAIEPDVVAYALDAELDNTWGVKRIGSGDAQTITSGEGVKVAVIDSGIDYTHPDLATNYAGGYDFVNNDSNPMDDNGHGTHVAGTIAALKNEVGVVGVGPKISLYALKVLNASGSGRFSDIIAALDWAVANGIQITNNSYGSASNPGTIVEDAFINASANGVINVVAAGNSGTCNGKGSNVNYPARYTSVLAVVAVSQNDARPCFSSTGPEVGISAPGVIIKSAKLGGGYVEFSGTSMASPHVTGAAAMLISAGIKDLNNDNKINDEVINVLNQTADDLGVSGRDNFYGFGLVNVSKAVRSILADEGTTTPPTETAMKVSSVTYSTNGGRNKNNNLSVLVHVENSSGSPVGGASVSVTIRKDLSTWSGSGLTDDSGAITFSVSNAKSGCYSTSIKSVTFAGYLWDGVNPDEGYCK